MRSRSPSLPRRQDGIVLMVALIMLVAMSLAGVALMRSVETAVMVAGNFAFKESAVLSTDQGVQVAATWVGTTNKNSPATLYDDNPSIGYFSSLPSVDPNFFDEGTWTQSALVNGGAADAAGNKVRYIVHRMCSTGGTNWSDPDNECMVQMTSAAEGEGYSNKPGAPPPLALPIIYYRVTTRVDGPRNTVTISQTSLAQKI
jgi:Tfp pilus assembly protein PilX